MIRLINKLIFVQMFIFFAVIGKVRGVSLFYSVSAFSNLMLLCVESFNSPPLKCTDQDILWSTGKRPVAEAVVLLKRATAAAQVLLGPDCQSPNKDSLLAVKGDI